VELSRQVVTLATQTPERAWLGEVSAVALQQSLADLDRAYRNYFRNLQRVKAARARGDKAKLRVRKPRFKSRHHEQAVRFTLNSRFRVLPDGRLSLPKVGRLKVRWSRSLPAAPSSVTITLDRAGRYHASFVVEAVEAPLAPAETAVGIDLGLTSFATLSDGRKVDNPRWLRQRERALRRSQRNMSRKRKGSRNRDKARLRAARLHTRVADARRDFHHQLSTNVIGEHQTVCVETLNVAGLGRSRFAKSIPTAVSAGASGAATAWTTKEAWYRPARSRVMVTEDGAEGRLRDQRTFRRPTFGSDRRPSGSTLKRLFRVNLTAWL